MAQTPVSRETTAISPGPPFGRLVDIRGLALLVALQPGGNVVLHAVGEIRVGLVRGEAGGTGPTVVISRDELLEHVRGPPN